MNELSLFTGVGGGLLASRLLGFKTRCACEIDAFSRDVLLQRQRDGALSKFPIWDDIRTLDGNPWRSAIDVVTGGFPCQDISSAGAKRGLAGASSGLFFEMLRVISEVQPRYVFAENSPRLRTNGLGTVIKGLAGLGYDSRWCVLGGRHVGAPHKRDRMWVLATNPKYGRERVQPKYAEMAMPCLLPRSVWGPPEDCLEGVDDGVANRMDRIRATGNGQIPLVAATAWRILSN